MDVAIWLNLATRGDTVYLVDALSAFRIHPDQQQQRDSEHVLQWYRRSMEISARAWSRLGLLASVAQNALRVRPFGDPAKPWEERPAVVRDAA
jgi:hypothetical protein